MTTIQEYKEAEQQFTEPVQWRGWEVELNAEEQYRAHALGINVDRCKHCGYFQCLCDPTASVNNYDNPNG